MRTEKNIYAVYKKDQLVTIGTCSECAEFLGVTKKYIRWMTTPSYQKKIAHDPSKYTTCIKLGADE